MEAAQGAEDDPQIDVLEYPNLSQPLRSRLTQLIGGAALDTALNAWRVELDAAMNAWRVEGIEARRKSFTATEQRSRPARARYDLFATHEPCDLCGYRVHDDVGHIR